MDAYKKHVAEDMERRFAMPDTALLRPVVKAGYSVARGDRNDTILMPWHTPISGCGLVECHSTNRMVCGQDGGHAPGERAIRGKCGIQRKPRAGTMRYVCERIVWGEVCFRKRPAQPQSASIDEVWREILH
jgi:hypothetical protein